MSFAWAFGFQCQVECFVERMKVDWDRMGKGNKKPWNLRDGQILHATCGVFLTLTDDLEVQLPKQDWNECAPRLDQQFFSGFLDAELQRLLDSCVPPVPSSQVSFLRRRSKQSPIGVGFLVFCFLRPSKLLFHVFTFLWQEKV